MDSGEVLRIRNWDEHYENNRTRSLKHMEWVPIPNKLDDDGYVDLVDHPNEAAHLGCWLGIVEVTSKCRPRGLLIRDNGSPHTPDSLARLTRLPAEIFREVIPRLIVIRWLESIPQAGAVTAHDSAETTHESAESLRPSDYGREGKGMEGRKGKKRTRQVRPNGRSLFPFILLIG
jgi:hypothetical protein